MRVRPTTSVSWLGSCFAACALSSSLAALSSAPANAMPDQTTATAQGAAAEPAATQPAYVVRGKQAEVRQRALRERVERFHQTLTTALKAWAPDVLKTLDPPPPGVFGYQILPRIVADAPPGPPSKPQVVSYHWRWSETLITQEMATLDRLETDLDKIPPTAASRAAYDVLTADYKKLILVRVQVETNNPRPSGQAAQTPVVRSQHWQATLQLSGHARHVREHPVREFLFPKFIPDVLLRV